MFESTAVWAEDKVFDGINDWFFYLPSWATLPGQPITSAGDGVSPSADDLKMYGSAIWNHWVERRYGPETIRRAWSSRSRRRSTGSRPRPTSRRSARSTRPRASRRRSPNSPQPLPSGRCPTAASRRAANSPSRPTRFRTSRGPRRWRSTRPMHSRSTTPRSGSRTLPSQVPAPPPTSAWAGSLTKNALPGLDGSIALVGRKSNGDITKVMERDFDVDGDRRSHAPERRRLPANHRGVGQCRRREQRVRRQHRRRTWDWTGDDADGTLEASRVTGAPEGRIVDETGTTISPGAPPTADCGVTTVEHEPAVIPTPTPTASPTASPTATPTVTPTPTAGDLAEAEPAAPRRSAPPPAPGSSPCSRGRTRPGSSARSPPSTRRPRAA